MVHDSRPDALRQHVRAEILPVKLYRRLPRFSDLRLLPQLQLRQQVPVLQGVETETRTGQPLQQLDNASGAIYYKYGNAIPFFDFGNYYVSDGSIISPSILKGLTWAQVTSQLADPQSQTSQEMIGAANIYTAEICHMINNTAPVCSQNYVKAAYKQFLS